MIRAVNHASFYALLSILSFVTFSTYTGLGNVITPKKVFTVISIFSVARLYYYHLVVLCALGISDVWAASKRIQVKVICMKFHLLAHMYKFQCL